MKTARSATAIAAAVCFVFACEASLANVYYLQGLSAPLQGIHSANWDDATNQIYNYTTSGAMTNWWSATTGDPAYGGELDASQTWYPIIPPVPANGSVVADSESIILTGTWFAQCDKVYSAWAFAAVSSFHLADILDASHGEPGDSTWASYPTLSSNIYYGGDGTNSSSQDLIHGYFKPGSSNAITSSLSITVDQEVGIYSTDSAFNAVQSFNYGAHWQRVIDLAPLVEIRASSIGSNDGTGGLYFTDSHGGTDTATPSTVTTSGTVSTPLVVFALTGGSNLAGTGTLAMTGSAQTIDSNTGNNVVRVPVAASGTLNINAAGGSSIKFTQPFALASGTNVLISGYSLGTSGASGVEMRSFTASNLTISGATVKLTASSGTLVVDQLDLVPNDDPDSPGPAVLDITNNHVVIHDQVPGDHEASYDLILAMVDAGRDGGDWDGPGIISSWLVPGSAHLSSWSDMEVIDNYGSGGVAVYDTWGGVSVGPDDILIDLVSAIQSSAPVPEPTLGGAFMLIAGSALVRPRRK